MDILYIVIPAYNEVDGIEEVVKAWYPIIERNGAEGRSKLVVIDDGSEDGTYEKMLALRDRMPLVVALTKDNGGHGETVLVGYYYALSNGADFVFQTDSDGQTDPAEFDDFWNNRNDYDAQFGNRSIRGDGKARALVERVVCLLVKLYFGVSVPDANAPFRLMNREYLEDILPFMPKDYALPNIILTALGPRLGKRVAFREVSFMPRVLGKSTMNMRRIVRMGAGALKDFHAIRRTVKQHERQAKHAASKLSGVLCSFKK